MFQVGNQPFQTIKISNLKSGKHCIFAKWLIYSFGQKFQTFSFFVLQIKWDHKKSFITFQIDNQPFYTLKISNFKSGKTFIFAKGLVHGFGQKNAIFYPVFFQIKQAHKKSFMNFQIENQPSQIIPCFLKSNRPIKSLS